MSKQNKKYSRSLDMNSKYRLWNCILWPENQAHNEAIVRLIQEFNCVGILHNQDTFTDELATDEDEEFTIDGELLKNGDSVKPHYHFIIRFPNARYRTALAKELGVEFRRFEPTGNWYASAKYLLHIGSPEKYQYDIEDLVGNLKADVIKLIDDIPIEEKYISVINWIDENKRYVNNIQLQRYCISQNLFGVLRSCYKFLTDYLASHNSHYQDRNINGKED